MPPEVALLESRALRESVADRTDTLDRVKVLVLLPDDMHVTTKMVADYFEVGVETIQSLIKDHRSELTANGYRVIAGQELMSFKDISRVHVRTGSLALFPRRAVLNVAMLLRDSAVARRVRTYLLDTEATHRQGPPSWGMPPGRRLGPGPHWDEYEYLQAHPDVVTPEQYSAPDQGRWLAWADSVDHRLDAHGRVIGAMSEQLCRVGDDVRELRGDMSAMRQDVAELRQGMAQLLPGFGLGAIPAKRRRRR
ncbi:hypothetical protein EDD99_3814 [Streptomyces sp. 846.5]|nr:hypothetical protein [Streptomyces sp. 846.5]TDU05306.1 hypothetical protein EDD99_3814 [Streptomyces sp. 846.5]